MTDRRLRITRLEAATEDQADSHEVFTPPSWWTEILTGHIETVLNSMEPQRSARTCAILTDGRGGWQSDPVAHRVIDLALSSTPKGEPEWFPWSIRGWVTVRQALVGPLVLPERICEVLDEHPRAKFDYYDCADCGTVMPEDWRTPECESHGHDRPTDGRGLLIICPHCGGPCGFTAYASRLRRERFPSHSADPITPE